MINLIIGQKGAGKTKKMIQMANDAVDTTKGNIIFIDDDKRAGLMNLQHKIRFIDVRDYNVRSFDAFFGFLTGLLASNYDVEKIYLDGLYNLTNIRRDELERFVACLEGLIGDNDITVYIAINITSETLPAALSKYVLEELKVI